MKKTKLLLSTISLVTLPACILPITSCNNTEEKTNYDVELIDSEGVTLKNTKFQLGKTYTTIVSLADETLKVGSINVWMDDASLPARDFSYNPQTRTLEIRGKFMTSKFVKIKVNLTVMNPIIKMPKTDNPLIGETTVDSDTGSFKSKVYIKDCEFTNMVTEDDKRWLLGKANVKDPGEQINLNTNINWTTGNKFNLEITTDDNAYFYGKDKLNTIVISFRYRGFDVELGTEQTEYQVDFPTSVYLPKEPGDEVINVYPKVAENDGAYFAEVNGFKIINPANPTPGGGIRRQVFTEVTLNKEDTTDEIAEHITVDRLFDTESDPFVFGIKFTIKNNDAPSGDDFVDGKLLPATGQYTVSVDIKHSYKDNGGEEIILAKAEKVHFSIHIVEDMQTPQEVTILEGTPTEVDYNQSAKAFDYNTTNAYKFYGYGPKTTIEVTNFEHTASDWTPRCTWTQDADDATKHRYNLQITIPQGLEFSDSTIVYFGLTIKFTYESGETKTINFPNNAFKINPQS